MKRSALDTLTRRGAFESDARALAGNWTRFDSFGWHDRPDTRPESWAIVYTCNRDSDALTRSNAAAIDAVMEPFAARGVAVREHHGHWACGWVDGWAFPAVTSTGHATRVALAWCELQARLEDYPCLDEEAFSALECEEWNEAFENERPSLEWATDAHWNEVRETLGEGGYGEDNYPSRGAIAAVLESLYGGAAECELCAGPAMVDGECCDKCEADPARALATLAAQARAQVAVTADGRWSAYVPDGTVFPARFVASPYPSDLSLPLRRWAAAS